MSFFNFRNQTKFSDVEKILSHNEATSKAALHEKHPHTVGLFDKHQVDLREIRQKGTKVAAAATILGAFLAFPHLLGHGTTTEKAPDPGVQTLSVERQVDHPGSNSGSGNGVSNPNSNSVAVNNSTPTQNTSNQADPNNPNVDKKDRGSQGHIHGRSYLAPPKDHGYHDLGLHKGEDKGNGNAEAPGPHPEDLGINHQTGGPK